MEAQKYYYRNIFFYSLFILFESINPLSYPDRAYTQDTLPIYLGVWTLLGLLKELMVSQTGVPAEKQDRIKKNI